MSSINSGDTLKEIIANYRKDGFKIRWKTNQSEQKWLILSVSKNRAIYTDHIKEIMKLGNFRDYSIQNGLYHKAEIWFSE